jgi:hypothetical protein
LTAGTDAVAPRSRAVSAPTVEAARRDERSLDATLWSAVVLSAAYVLTGVVAVLSCASLALGHPERLETGLYAVALLVTPLGVVAARKNLEGLSAATGHTLALLNAIAIASLLVAARFAHELSGHVGWALCLMLVGSLAIAAANVEVARRHRVVERLPGNEVGRLLPAATAVLLVGAANAFVLGSALGPAAAVLAVGSTLALLAAWHLWPVTRASARRRRVVDVIVVAVMCGIVVDVGAYGDAHPTTTTSSSAP